MLKKKLKRHLKAIEEERQWKEEKDSGGDTHPMETDILEASTTGVDIDPSCHDLGLGI